MKKRRLTLRQYVTIYLSGLTLIMVVFYGVLLHKYMLIGLDEASARDMRLDAKAFARILQLDPDTPLPRSPRVRAFIGTGKLPPWVTREFPPHTYRHGRLQVGHNGEVAEGYGHGLAFLLPYDLPDGRQLILLKTYSHEEAVAGIDFKLFSTVAWSLGLVFILLVVLVVRYMLRRLSTPVEELGTWLGKLPPSQIGQSHPDFRFDEINQLADLLQNAIGQLHQALEREHRFLRNASHELRTPIAVAMSNLELWELMRPDPDKAEQAVYGRIWRAVDNMHKLTQTLLWLSRNNENAPSCESVALDALVSELVAENQYLLKGKSVSLSMDAEPGESMLSAVACRIVLSNLTRNAFQYTDRGEISIGVRPGLVVIKNISRGQADSQPEGDDFGFGLGLGIVEQVTEKMGWNYQIKEAATGREVRVTFQDSP